MDRAAPAHRARAMGRGATQELDVAGDLFARVGRRARDGDRGARPGRGRPRPGRPAPARAARIAAARDRMAERGNVRGLAETLLLASDLHLAARQPEDADRTALESLDLYRVVRDAEGQCRSRTRRAHALIELGRVGDAAAEARRALASAAPSAPRPGRARASRARPGAAARGPRRGRGRRSTARRDGGRAAIPRSRRRRRSGRALARRGARGDETVRAGLAGLEALGRSPRCSPSASPISPSCAPRRRSWRRTLAAERAAEAAPSYAVTAAAAALLADGAWADRWVAAMRALRPALPWWRAALVARPSARSCAATSIGAVPAAAAATWPGTSPPPAPPGWSASTPASGPRTRPACSTACGRRSLAPAWPGATLYVDLREGIRPPEGTSALADVARLLACRPPDPAPSPADAAAFPGIVGACPALRDLLATLARVAPSDLTVHVSGETGTGKEALAEALHARSRPARGPFVAVNASSLSDELFETEMFGHVPRRVHGRGRRTARATWPRRRAARSSSTRWPTSRRGAQAKLLRFVAGARVPPGRGDARCAARTCAW